MQILRNGTTRLEELHVTLEGRGYRVTGFPTVAADKYAMVEVFRAETMHGWRDRVRFGHWARVTSTKRKALVREAALQRPEGIHDHGKC